MSVNVMPPGRSRSSISRLVGLLAIAVTAWGSPAPASADEATLPQTRGAGTARWHWRGRPDPGASLTVDVVRGDVRVERSTDGMVQIRASVDDPDGNGSAATLRLETVGARMRLVDVYPASPAWPTECLPPDGVHGGFASYRDTLHVVIRVPRSVRVIGVAGSQPGPAG